MWLSLGHQVLGEVLNHDLVLMDELAVRNDLGDMVIQKVLTVLLSIADH